MFSDFRVNILIVNETLSTENTVKATLLNPVFSIVFSNFQNSLQLYLSNIAAYKLRANELTKSMFELNVISKHTLLHFK